MAPEYVYVFLTISYRVETRAQYDYNYASDILLKPLDIFSLFPQGIMIFYHLIDLLLFVPMPVINYKYQIYQRFKRMARLKQV